MGEHFGQTPGEFKKRTYQNSKKEFNSRVRRGSTVE
jgi:hypothetical protein